MSADRGVSLDASLLANLDRIMAERGITSDRFPRVKGRCPACNGASLFLGEGGYVTCSRIDCTQPAAASDLLERS